MKNKKCFKCLRTLPLSDFYAHKQMGDGHLNKCRDCARKDAEFQRMKKLKDPVWKAREEERMRKKALKANYEFPEVATARRAVRTLGRSKDYHWHHWSYRSEHKLDVFKLDPIEHRRAHRYMIYDRERLQYRKAKDGVLLDSRESHATFLKSLSITEIT